MAPRRTCRALAAAALMCVLTTRMAAAQQQTSSPTASGGDDGSKLPVSLERIRQGIQRDPKLTLDFLDPSIPLFRISVQEKPLKLEDYWKIGPDTAVSRDVRPSFASTWHHDFMSMVTPKQHIAASPFGIFGNPVHPVGPPVLAITKAIKSAFTNAERGRIRRQIQEELKALEANQAQQPQKPSTETVQTPKTPKTPTTQDTQQPQQTPAGSNGATSKPVPNNPR